MSGMYCIVSSKLRVTGHTFLGAFVLFNVFIIRQSQNKLVILQLLHTKLKFISFCSDFVNKVRFPHLHLFT